MGGAAAWPTTTLRLTAVGFCHAPFSTDQPFVLLLRPWPLFKLRITASFPPPYETKLSRSLQPPTLRIRCTPLLHPVHWWLSRLSAATPPALVPATPLLSPLFSSLLRFGLLPPPTLWFRYALPSCPGGVGRTNRSCLYGCPVEVVSLTVSHQSSVVALCVSLH